MVGFLADLPRVDSLVINNVALILAGVASALAPFCVSYPLLIVFSSVFGLCMGKLYMSIHIISVGTNVLIYHGYIKWKK